MDAHIQIHDSTALGIRRGCEYCNMPVKFRGSASNILLVRMYDMKEIGSSDKLFFSLPYVLSGA